MNYVARINHGGIEIEFYKSTVYADKLVMLDTPTRPADGWSELETLACGKECLDLI